MENSFELALKSSLDRVPDGNVKDAALYSLLSGGKRFRPELLFTTLDAYHITREKGTNAAIALEMIHTYSLIHDDLPAMDNDDLRRGVATCHIKYGEATAILAGDALLSEAFYFVKNGSTHINTACELISLFVDSCGLNGMIYGQELDIENEDKQLSIEELYKIHAYKTGKLITCAFCAACLISERPSDLDVWYKVGEKVGIIFQIQDDILDVESSEDVLGKPINSDSKNNKTTYITLLGKEKCINTIETLYQEIMELLETIVIDKDPLVAFLNKMLNRTY